MIQRDFATEPVAELRSAIANVALEARQRGIHADSLLVQLRVVVDDVCSVPRDTGALPAIRDVMVLACMKAYFQR